MSQTLTLNVLNDFKSTMSGYNFKFDYDCNQSVEISKNESFSRDRFTINLYEPNKKQCCRQKITTSRKTLQKDLNKTVQQQQPVQNVICEVSRRHHRRDYLYKVKRPITQFLQLYDEHNRACAKIVETTKIMKMIDQGSGGWAEKLEAEKHLLISCVSEKLIIDKIRDDYEYHYENEDESGGVVKLSKFKFYFQQPNRVHHKSTNFYLLLILNGIEVKSSNIVRATDRNIDFKEQFTLQIKGNPEIHLELYSITLKCQNKLNNIYSSLRKSARKKCLMKLLFKNPNTGDVEERNAYKSTFELCGRTTISLRNLQDDEHHDFFPESDTNLKDIATFDLQFIKKSDSEIPRSGFLNFGFLKGEVVPWERCWCVLTQNKFKIYRYPSDDRPFLDLNLRNCLDSKTHNCFRPKSFSFDIKIDNEDTVLKCYVRCDTLYELSAWRDDFNQNLAKLANR